MGTANPASTGQARVERGKAEPAEALLWTCPCCLPPKWLASPSYYSVLVLFFFFFFLWLHWVLVVECRLSLVAASRDHSLWQCRTSHCSGFSCYTAQVLGTWASAVAACGLSSCPSRARGL